MPALALFLLIPQVFAFRGNEPVRTPAPEPASVPARASAGAPAFSHVILVSVDGLHPTVLALPHIEHLPAFARLLRGPHTLEARTDPEFTVTLPNHVDMVTGVLASEHKWVWNEEPPSARHGGTIHARADRYVPSAFDVAHDQGCATGVFAGKTKFWLFEQSWGEAGGRKDETGEDDGKAKIDLVVYAESTATLIDQLAARLEKTAAQEKRSLDFLHVAEPDNEGHAHGWDLNPGSKYLESILKVDRLLGVLLDRIDAHEALRGRVAIVLTADHGGGDPFKTHTKPDSPCNFTIPFLVWLGVDREPQDLYDLNAGVRTRPSPDANPRGASEAQPIRNADLGNLGLRLLGLPAIPGSRFGGAEGLHLIEEDGIGPKEQAAPKAPVVSADQIRQIRQIREVPCTLGTRTFEIEGVTGAGLR